jgi:hypothetical protein
MEVLKVEVTLTPMSVNSDVVKIAKYGGLKLNMDPGMAPNPEKEINIITENWYVKSVRFGHDGVKKYLVRSGDEGVFNDLLCVTEESIYDLISTRNAYYNRGMRDGKTDERFRIRHVSWWKRLLRFF